MAMIMLRQDVLITINGDNIIYVDVFDYIHYIAYVH